jgi:hypothetical protein
MTMPRGNIPDILFGLGLWSFFVQRMQNKSATESDKCFFLNGWLYYMLFLLTLYTERENRLFKNDHPRENLPNLFWGLGLCSSFWDKKTLLSCTKSNLPRNQTNGVLTVGSMQFGVFMPFSTQKEQIAGPTYDHATRKYPGHIVWVRALVLILCKGDILRLYKNDLQQNQKNSV